MINFYNPHSSDFLSIPISYKLLRKKPLLKYGYLLKFNSKVEYIFDFRESSFFKKKTIAKYLFFLLPFLFLEIILWSLINKIAINKINFSFQKQFNQHSNLFVMSYKSLTDIDQSTLKFFNSFEQVYIHLTHYFIRTKEKAKNISKIKTKVTLLGDSDFRDNSYYKKYFKKKHLNFEVLPFKPHDRFKKKKLRRIDRLYSGGTVHKLNLERPKKYYSDFRNFFKVNSYHTIRPYLSNYSIDFLDNAHGAWSEQAKLIGGNTYFKSDLCDIFNRYIAVIYGSELSGAPSISNLEAICCGSIALMDRKYIKGLPLIEGVDFVHVNEHAKNLEKELKEKFNLAKKIYSKKNRKLDFKKRYNFFLKKKLKSLNIEKS
jgi:hypothetical protein